MKLVLDASVALKWFFRGRTDEDDVPAALALLQSFADGTVTCFQPPHFVAEVAAVLTRESPETAQRDLADLLALDFQIVHEPEVYALAVDLGVQLGHHLFDTLYHALALTDPALTLATADRRYQRKARRLGGISLLSELSIPVGR